MSKRSQILRKQTLERDSFTCQKCKIDDKTGKILEVHHIIPLYKDGKDSLNNTITLCKDCHHFAPNHKTEFNNYLKEECTGTITTFLKAWEKVRQEHPELIK